MAPSNIKLYKKECKNSVLVVDDDYRIRNLLKRFLSKNNYMSVSAQNYNTAINFLETFIFDIVIVDVMMPGKDGFELTKIIGERFQVPVFMLTARTDINDKLQGFRSGADDYLTKPFEPEELLVRIKAIIRRNKSSMPKRPRKNLNYAEFVLDIHKQTLKINGNDISLTNNEVSLLNIFKRHKNKILSRDEIMRELNATKTISLAEKKINNNRLIDLQITRLRKKIEPNPTYPMYLKTIRGQGYKLYLES